MRNHRDTMIVWTVALVLAVLLAAVIVSAASAHRPVSSTRATTLANRYVARHYCGHRLNFKCQGVATLPEPCGRHTYCWSGLNFGEARCVAIIGAGDLCWAYRWGYSRGWVNGHTGKVTGGGEWL